MRERLKGAYYFFQKLLGRNTALLESIKRNNLAVILNLHQVSPNSNPFWPPLPPDVFDDLLRFLSERFEVVRLQDLNASPGDRPRAVLSFDDGYRNFTEYAVPVLEKYRMTANMNIIPSCVESGKPMWNVQLYDFLNAAPRLLINEIRLPGFDFRLRSTGISDKLRYGLNISRFLKNRPRSERQELWNNISLSIQKCDFSMTRMMDRDEVLAAAEKHEIGVHSFSHESMGFEEDAFFQEDFEKCRRYFDEQLGLPLQTYAFPNGSYREEQIETLRKNGILHILLVGERYARPGDDVLPRFTIYGSSKLETRFHALGINGKL